MHPYHVSLQLSTLKNALRHIRTTLTNLTVHYQHYNNICLDVVTRESDDTVASSLGPLKQFSRPHHLDSISSSAVQYRDRYFG
jgi:hypothetical protein